MLSAKASQTLSFQGSKSIIQRLMAIQAISKTALIYNNISACADVREMSDALLSSGFAVEYHSAKQVSYIPQSANSQDQIYHFRESATALRLWVSVCAANSGHNCAIEISEQLFQRPLQPLLTALSTLGADIVSDGKTLHISGKQLSGGKIELQGNISSQFYSSLLLIAPTMMQDLHLALRPDMVSRSYLDLTLEMMATCGIHYELRDDLICIKCAQSYCLPSVYNIEPDWSSAAFFICLGTLLADGLCMNMDYQQASQPDHAIVPILQTLGARIDILDHHIRVHASTLHGGNIDCRNNPDLVPILSILGLFGSAPLRLQQLSHLRYKESDRIAGITALLDTIGAKYELADANLTIYPLQTTPPPSILNTQNDHRLLMAATLLNLLYPQLELSETTSVTKSFPDFWNLLQSLNISTI